MNDDGKLPERLGTRLLETVIASTAERPDTRTLRSPDPDAWSLVFPDLTHLPIEGEGNTDLRICIATEDIVGPVRNGGIGTTYSFLAKVLAAEGFDVTILYLRGHYVEIGTLDEWIAHYAEFGVTFKVVETQAHAEGATGKAERWTAPMYNMLRHLQDNQYDVVHVSEWRGSGYLSQLAKRQGWALQNTHFVVKCSSPWLWDRLYGSHPMKTLEDLLRSHAEQRSVELGDHIIGGSAHLLRWMASQGYRLARDRTFVQPNILSTEMLDRLVAARSHRAGDLIKIDEIVFFGRLEARKGIDTFCQAIDGLVRQGIALPGRITFMGKPGPRLEICPDLTVTEFIERTTAPWATEIQVLTEFQQEEALRYLLGGNRLAVMPSQIENSSLAVYEALICRIPFIASNSGGTPELVDPAWHEDVLCDAHPLSLCRSLKRALEQGGRVAGASFDNQQNTATWVKYHRNIGRLVAAPARAPVTSLPRIAAIIPHRDDVPGLKTTLKSLQGSLYPNLEIIVVDDGSHETTTAVQLDRIGRKLEAMGGKFLRTPGIDSGLAINAAWQQASADCLFVTRPGHAVLPGALERLARVLQDQRLGAVTGFALEYEGAAVPSSISGATRLHMPILGSIDYTMLECSTFPWDLLIDGAAFDSVGGCTGDFRLINAEKELYHALEFNGFSGQTVPEPTHWICKPSLSRLSADHYNLRASDFRGLRPGLRYGPQFFRNLLLLTFGLQQRNADLAQKVQEATLAKQAALGMRDRARADRDKERRAKQQRMQELSFVLNPLKQLKRWLPSRPAPFNRTGPSPEAPEFTHNLHASEPASAQQADVLHATDAIGAATKSTRYDGARKGANLAAKLAERNRELREAREKLTELRIQLKDRNTQLDAYRRTWVFRLVRPLVRSKKDRN